MHLSDLRKGQLVEFVGVDDCTYTGVVVSWTAEHVVLWAPLLDNYSVTRHGRSSLIEVAPNDVEYCKLSGDLLCGVCGVPYRHHQSVKVLGTDPPFYLIRICEGKYVHI